MQDFGHREFRQQLKRHHRLRLQHLGLGFCDDNAMRTSQVEAAYREVRGVWEAESSCFQPVVAAALDASTTDNDQQTIANTLANDRAFWSSTGSPSQVCDEALLYELGGAACQVQFVVMAVYRAFYQHGYPVYPPMQLQVWVGPSPHQLAPASPLLPVQATDALQTFALHPHAPVARFLQLRLYGKLQKQREDMQFYIAIRHVSALGSILPSPQLLNLGALLRAGALQLNPGGQLPGGFSGSGALRTMADWGLGPHEASKGVLAAGRLIIEQQQQQQQRWLGAGQQIEGQQQQQQQVWPGEEQLLVRQQQQINAAQPERMDLDYSQPPQQQQQQQQQQEEGGRRRDSQQAPGGFWSSIGSGLSRWSCPRPPAAAAAAVGDAPGSSSSGGGSSSSSNQHGAATAAAAASCPPKWLQQQQEDREQQQEDREQQQQQGQQQQQQHWWQAASSSAAAACAGAGDSEDDEFDDDRSEDDDLDGGIDPLAARGREGGGHAVLADRAYFDAVAAGFVVGHAAAAGAAAAAAGRAPDPAVVAAENARMDMMLMQALNRLNDPADVERVLAAWLEDEPLDATLPAPSRWQQQQQQQGGSSSSSRQQPVGECDDAAQQQSSWRLVPRPVVTPGSIGTSGGTANATAAAAAGSGDVDMLEQQHQQQQQQGQELHVDSGSASGGESSAFAAGGMCDWRVSCHAHLAADLVLPGPGGYGMLAQQAVAAAAAAVAAWAHAAAQQPAAGAGAAGEASAAGCQAGAVRVAGDELFTAVSSAVQQQQQQQQASWFDEGVEQDLLLHQQLLMVSG